MLLNLLNAEARMSRAGKTAEIRGKVATDLCQLEHTGDRHTSHKSACHASLVPPTAKTVGNEALNSGQSPSLCLDNGSTRNLLLQAKAKVG